MVTSRNIPFIGRNKSRRIIGVKLQLRGLNRPDFRRWETPPLTQELADEIVRVRAALTEAERRGRNPCASPRHCPERN